MHKFILLLSLALPVATTSADIITADDRLAVRTYWFGTHKARTTITFVGEADIESIHGVTNEMDGQVTVAKSGLGASGTLRVQVASLRTGIAQRDAHLRSPQWLDAKRHPHLTFEFVSMRPARNGQWAYEARLTIKGVTRDREGKAHITEFPERQGKALGVGAWVRVRTRFDVRLSDHGIVIPKELVSKVSDVWTVGIDIYGTSAQPKPRVSDIRQRRPR